MFSAFAGIAIVLAAVCLFAVTSYSVTHTQIGVRLALTVAVSASVWPAWPAGRLDRVIALRYE